MKNDTALAMERLISPALKENLDRLNKSYSLAAGSLINSSAFAEIKRINDRNELFLKAFRESRALVSLRESMERAETAHKLLSNNAYLKAAEFSLKKISPILNSAKSSQLTTFSSDIQRTLRSAASFANQNKAIIDQLAEHLNSNTFSSFTEFANDGSVLRSLEEFFDLDEDTDSTSEASLDEVSSDLTTYINSDTEFDDLPQRAKSYLTYVYGLFMQFLVGCIATYVMHHVLLAEKKLENASTPAEVRKLARNLNNGSAYEALEGFRVTTASSLHLRANPKMKADIIAALDLGTIVEVIDKTNRAWLFVEVQVGGESVQGWVARRYTTRFK